MAQDVVAILQARMGSTRLPGKVLLPILAEPMLVHIVRRVRPAASIRELVIATTELPEDDPIVALAGTLGVRCFRGSALDCLDRYYRAATLYNAAAIARLTADNPLVDAEFIDFVVGQFRSSNPGCDYVDSGHSGTFPHGLSVEVFTYTALMTAWTEDHDMDRREHVTPYIYQHPDRFRVEHLVSPIDYSDQRWTVDTPKDMEFVRRVYEHFGHDRFAWRGVLSAVERHPEWLSINWHIRQKAV